MGCPDTVMTTKSFLSEMVVWPRELRLPRSSMARPKRSVRGQHGPDVTFLEGQGISQPPSVPFVSTLDMAESGLQGLGQAQARCLSICI